MTHATEWVALRAECERLQEARAAWERGFAERGKLMEQLREALREQVVDEVGCICRLCYEEWDGEAERHAPGCLASKGEA